MEPYMRASQKMRQGDEQPFNLLKNAGLAALGGGSAGVAHKVLGKITPAIGAMISKYVPDNIMTAGLSKINPKLGTFMQSVIDAGYTHDDVREFLGQKIEQSKKQETSQDKRNLIEKHSPELHQFITEQMKKGRSHKEAGALATIGVGGKDFKKEIEKLKKEHKTTWEEILEAVYGGGKSASGMVPAEQQPAQPQQPMQDPQQAPIQQQPQAQPAQQAGPGQQALIAALGKIPKRSVK